MNAETLEQRSLQTRRFDTQDEQRLLTAAAGLLQDLGYTIDSSEVPLGLIVASKDRDATDGGQVVAAVFVAALTGVATPIDSHQKIRVSVVTKPTPAGTSLRVTFQRVVWNTQNQISRLELLDDPKMYQEFFERLSKAVFLEAHNI
jgi:hypothetical protein